MASPCFIFLPEMMNIYLRTNKRNVITEWNQWLPIFLNLWCPLPKNSLLSSICYNIVGPSYPHFLKGWYYFTNFSLLKRPSNKVNTPPKCGQNIPNLLVTFTVSILFKLSKWQYDVGLFQMHFNWKGNIFRLHYLYKRREPKGD